MNVKQKLASLLRKFADRLAPLHNSLPELNHTDPTHVFTPVAELRSINTKMQKVQAQHSFHTEDLIGLAPDEVRELLVYDLLKALPNFDYIHFQAGEDYLTGRTFVLATAFFLNANDMLECQGN